MMGFKGNLLSHKHRKLCGVVIFAIVIFCLLHLFMDQFTLRSLKAGGAQFSGLFVGKGIFSSLLNMTAFDSHSKKVNGEDQIKTKYISSQNSANTEYSEFWVTSQTTSSFQRTKDKTNNNNLSATSTKSHNINAHSKNVLSVDNVDQKKRTRTVYLNVYNPHDALMPSDAFGSCDPNIKCKLLKGKEYYENSSYVMFVGSEIDFDPPPKVRGQIWIFYSLEPPVYFYSNMKKWTNIFNWTMTYRRDSDIPYYYGKFQRKKHLNNQNARKVNLSSIKSLKDYSNILKANAKEAAWFVSRCGASSNRDRFVKMLQKYLNVDVYGRCGKLSCPRRNSDSCFTKLSKNYAFYLSFENSFCRDYITEKSFKMYIKNINVVPIVRGMMPGQYKLFLPLKSFIDTRSYKKVSQLGQDVKSVMGNKTEYLSYFTWRENFESVQNWINFGTKNGFCELCRRLHDPNLTTKYSRIYENVNRWIHGDKSFPICVTNIDDLQ